MALEYVIYKVPLSTKEKVTKRKKKYYKIGYKNKKSIKCKTFTAYYENGQRIEIYTTPKTPTERTQNNIALKEIKQIINEKEINRDKYGLTWHMVKEDIKRVKVEKAKSYYDNINYLWGETNIKARNEFKAFIGNYFQDLKAHNITQGCNAETYKALTNLINKLHPKLTAGYLRKIWQDFIRVNLQALALEWVNKLPQSNEPAEDILYPEPKQKINCVSEEDLKILDNYDVYSVKALQYTPKHTLDRYEDIRKAFLFSAIYSGLRPITMQNLKWKNIRNEKENYEIYVAKNYKNEKEHFVYVSKKAKEYIGDRKGDDEYVFPNYPRRPNKASNTVTIAKSWESIKHFAGIENNKITMRQCRHTHAFKTLHATDNNPWKVKERLGHKRIETTMNHYCKFNKEWYYETMKEVDKVPKFQV